MKKNEAYVLTDDDGNERYKCECGWSTANIRLAKEHYMDPCTEPKEWSPEPGEAEAPVMELDVLKRELAAAIQTAREEGERVGYNSGLAIAYQMVSDTKLAAERQGANALIPVLDEMKNQLDGFVLLAHQKLMEEGDGS